MKPRMEARVRLRMTKRAFDGLLLELSKRDMLPAVLLLQEAVYKKYRRRSVV